MLIFGGGPDEDDVGKEDEEVDEEEDGIGGPSDNAADNKIANSRDR